MTPRKSSLIPAKIVAQAKSGISSMGSCCWPASLLRGDRFTCAEAVSATGATFGNLFESSQHVFHSVNMQIHVDLITPGDTRSASMLAFLGSKANKHIAVLCM